MPRGRLISRCTRARPKIANYPFTTLCPALGIVELSNFRRFVVADIPGLIEGAHGGAGLGHEFLRHIERTRMLVHLLDIMPMDGSDPVENFHTINRELKLYSEILAAKPQMLVLNKMDLDPDGAIVADLVKRLGDTHGGVRPMAISAVTGKGIPELSEAIWQIMKGRPE